MTLHFQLSLQCNVSPIMGFIRYTAQKKKKWQLIYILVQWAMIGQDSMHVQHTTFDQCKHEIYTSLKLYRTVKQMDAELLFTVWFIVQSQKVNVKPCCIMEVTFSCLFYSPSKQCVYWCDTLVWVSSKSNLVSTSQKCANTTAMCLLIDINTTTAYSTILD